VKFPLYLRIPRWCMDASVKVNGKAVRCAAKPLMYVVMEREWKDGDTVSLRLPMRVSIQKWEKNHDAVSVNYGPLTFSLKIGERWERSGAKIPAGVAADAQADFECRIRNHPQFACAIHVRQWFLFCHRSLLLHSQRITQINDHLIFPWKGYSGRFHDDVRSESRCSCRKVTRKPGPIHIR